MNTYKISHDCFNKRIMGCLALCCVDFIAEGAEAAERRDPSLRSGFRILFGCSTVKVLFGGDPAAPL